MRSWKDGGYLLFSDIYNSKIMKISARGTSDVYRAYTNASNGNAVDSQGCLYTCERDGHRVVRQKNGSITVVAEEYEGRKLNSPNDVAVRKDGNVYFSDPAAGALPEHQELDFNGVYRVSPRGKVTLIAKMARPNGLALPPTEIHCMWRTRPKRRSSLSILMQMEVLRAAMTSSRTSKAHRMASVSLSTAISTLHVRELQSTRRAAS